MKNKLTDLNNHLFEQLERLNDTDLQGDKLASEIERSKAITSVAHAIIDNAQLALDAQTAIREFNIKPPAMLLIGPESPEKKPR